MPSPFSFSIGGPIIKFIAAISACSFAFAFTTMFTVVTLPSRDDSGRAVSGALSAAIGPWYVSTSRGSAVFSGSFTRKVLTAPSSLTSSQTPSTGWKL